MIPTNKTVEIYYLRRRILERIRRRNQKSFLGRRSRKEKEEPQIHYVR